MNIRTDGRKYRNEEEWREIVSRFETREVAVKEFCEQERIGKSSLQRWRKKLSGMEKSVKQGKFIEVSPALEQEASVIEVELPHGITLRIRG